MGSSQVDIVNSALTLLGADTINAITDQGNAARAMASIWDSLRDAETRKHRWKFAIRRGALPALAAVPASGVYQQQFALPAGCLRVLEVGDHYPGVDLSDYRSGPTTDDYSVEGNLILSNLAAPLAIRYMVSVTDTTQWDASFCNAFSAALAVSSCYRITQSHDGEKVASAAYTQAIRDAIRANALESPPQQPADDTWVATRPVGAGGAPNLRYG